jgi:hypothetical protein
MIFTCTTNFRYRNEEVKVILFNRVNATAFQKFDFKGSFTLPKASTAYIVLVGKTPAFAFPVFPVQPHLHRRWYA